MLPELFAGVLLAGLTAYAVLAGADFGAGVWDLTAGGAKRGGPVRGMVKRSMSPVWEANHVWLIFVLVIFWTAFPVAFGAVSSTLYIPLFLAALGIIFRGTAFALRGQAATIGEARLLGAVFALASLLTPFFLGTVLGGIASGRVPPGNATGDPWSSWLNPTSALTGTLAVLTGAYLSAVYLAADSTRVAPAELAEAFRRRALGCGVITGLITIGGLFILREDARSLYDGLSSGGGLALVGASTAAGIATLVLVWRRRFGPARATAIAAVASVTAGWAVAQSPYLLPPKVTLEAAAAGHSTLVALVVAMVVGLIVLVPSLVFLYRLVLDGSLDQAYEPLDQRFQPLRAGDHKPEGDG